VQENPPRTPRPTSIRCKWAARLRLPPRGRHASTSPGSRTPRPLPPLRSGRVSRR
jgi:hypothetical protein